MVQLISFGFKHGVPKDAYVIDCRRLANPHFNARLRVLTGRDAPVQEFVKKDPRFRALLALGMEAIKEGVQVIAFGCFGGRHRSVAMVEITAASLRAAGAPVTVFHRQLDKDSSNVPKRRLINS